MSQRARIAIGGAVGGIVLLMLAWYAAFHIGVVEHADGAAFRAFTGLQRPRIDQLARFLVQLCDPKPYVYLCAVPLLVAVARRRFAVAVAIAAILLGANVTTQLLKPLLAHPRYAVAVSGIAWSPAGSWPSGHSTAAMSLALCSVLAAPSWLRPLLAALGGSFAVAVGYALLTLGSHLPSDVLGGFLVAGTWTMLAVAALLVVRERPAPPSTAEGAGHVTVRAALGPPGGALLAALGLVVIAALARPHDVVAYARAHEAFMAAAGAIGAIGLALATGVMLTLVSGSDRDPTAAPRRGWRRG